MWRKGKKGQSTMEYAIIIAVVVSALLAMQYYMGRGVQGKLRDSIDSVGQQYSAGNVKSKVTTHQLSTSKTQEMFGLDPADGVTRDDGISHYEVVTAAPVERKALLDDKEVITTPLNVETLFP